MRIAALTLLLVPSLAWGQAAVYPVGNGRPSAAEARKEMGIPSTDEVRGQLDNVGYASKPEAMAKVWELAAQPPAPRVARRAAVAGRGRRSSGRTTTTYTRRASIGASIRW